jgi:hypothetical protein
MRWLPFLLVTLLAPSPARAEDKPALLRPREGTYVTIGARPYYEFGSYTLEPTTRGLRSQSTLLHGPGSGVDFALGHSLRPNLAVAADLGISFGSLEQSGSLGGSSMQGSTAGARAGATIDWYSSSHLHWMGGFGLTARVFSATQVAVDGYGGAGEPMIGINWRAGVGYRAGVLDLRLRLDAGTMVANRATYVPIVLSTEVAIASF